MLNVLNGSLAPLGVGRWRGGYKDKVLATASGSLLAYWALDDSSGTQITDYAGSGRHGVYQGAVTPGGATFDDGTPAPMFASGGGYANLYSAALAGAFSAGAGTLLLWVKPDSASRWSASGGYFIANIRADDDNRVSVTKPPGSVVRGLFNAGGTHKQVDATPPDHADFICIAVTWDTAADAFKLYVAGSPVGATQTGLGTWAGALNASSVGVSARDTGFTGGWSGSIAHVALWSTALSAGQIADLASI